MPPLLTETAVKSLKQAEKARKIYDERRLFLFVPPTGARLWRMKYKIGGREKLLALGEWPNTSLKRARERRDEVRRMLADGIDPAVKKRQSAKRQRTPSPHSPESISTPSAARSARRRYRKRNGCSMTG